MSPAQPFDDLWQGELSVGHSSNSYRGLCADRAQGGGCERTTASAIRCLIGDPGRRQQRYPTSRSSQAGRVRGARKPVPCRISPTSSSTCRAGKCRHFCFFFFFFFLRAGGVDDGGVASAADVFNSCRWKFPPKPTSCSPSKLEGSVAGTSLTWFLPALNPFLFWLPAQAVAFSPLPSRSP